MNYTGTGGGEEVQFANVHQEANSLDVPGVTSWSILALGALLLGGGLWASRRLRPA
jgi:hypothetical protein